MKLKIGNVELANSILLAPMAGVTDLPFRVLCKEQGCGMVYSEMISAKGILHDNVNTKALTSIAPEEGPAAIQLFGSSPELMAEAAAHISSIPFSILDINMGCPASKIVKNGEGSALMKNPRLMGKIVEAVVKTAGKPVTVKMRKGFDNCQVNAVECAKIVEAAGASAIAVHGRTREEYYSGQADWDVIARVKEAVSIPVIGNGDIKEPEDVTAMLKKTGCDGVMIGRSAQGNPWIFSRALRYQQTGVILPLPSIDEKIETALRHCKSLIAYKGQYIAILEARKHLCWYTKGLPGSGGLRAKINTVQSYEDIETLLQTMQRS